MKSGSWSMRVQLVALSPPSGRAQALVTADTLRRLEATPCDFVCLTLGSSSTLAKLIIHQGPPERTTHADAEATMRVSDDTMVALGAASMDGSAAAPVITATRVPAVALQLWTTVEVMPRAHTEAPPSAIEARFELCCDATRSVHAWSSHCRCTCTLAPRRADVTLFGASVAGAMACQLQCCGPATALSHGVAERAATDPVAAGGAEGSANTLPKVLQEWGLIGERTHIRSLPAGSFGPRARLDATVRDAAAEEERREADGVEGEEEEEEEEAPVAMLRAALRRHAAGGPHSEERAWPGRQPLLDTPALSRVLLCGPRGAGKSSVVARLCLAERLPLLHATPAQLARLGGSAPDEALRRLLCRARQCRPCVILLDGMDEFAPSEAAMATPGAPPADHVQMSALLWCASQPSPSP